MDEGLGVTQKWGGSVLYAAEERLNMTLEEGMCDPGGEGFQ